MLQGYSAGRYILQPSGGRTPSNAEVISPGRDEVASTSDVEVLSPQRILEQIESLQGAQDNSIPPWEAIKNAYAPTQVELDNVIQEARAKIPFVNEEGVSYSGFQQAHASRGKGQCHGLVFNPFNQSSFPQGLYWPDVALQIKEI